MVLTIQPSVLWDLAADRDNTERGLLARFLTVFPESHFGHADHFAPVVPDDLKMRWNHLLRKLADVVRYRPDGPFVLEFTPEAYEAYLRFCQDTEPRKRQGGDLSLIAEFAGKQKAHLVRLAGILAIVRLLTESEGSAGSAGCAGVGVQEIEDACRLWEYFALHQMKISSVLGESVTNKVAKRVIAYLTRKPATSFTLKECFDVVRSSTCRTVDDLLPALELLVEHKYLRELPVEPSSPQGGRPKSPSYEVSPFLRVAPSRTTRTTRETSDSESESELQEEWF